VIYGSMLTAVVYEIQICFAGTRRRPRRASPRAEGRRRRSLPPSIRRDTVPATGDRDGPPGTVGKWPLESHAGGELAPDRISFPLLAAVYRAPLGKVDFSLFLTGQTGTFKTALAALCQQHFGAAMEASHLPANFSSTANALEGLAFSAKDALLVVDDFVLIGGPGNNALQGLAERLFRATGNHQGRSRMGGGGRLLAPHPPRGLVLATGEEVPRGQSIRARLLIVGLRPAEVDRSPFGPVSECGTAGTTGCRHGRVPELERGTV
jgi:hypothetical protein